MFFLVDTTVVFDDENVFTATTIEKYIATLTDLTTASRSNLRSMLYRMSELILGTTGKGDMTYALSASSPSEPYSVSDQRQVQAWQKAQTSARSGDARVLVVLGFGAGLSAGEITAVRPGHIEFGKDDAGQDLIFVTVAGERSRRVQVDKAWAVGLAAVASERQSAKWLFAPNRTGAGKNLVSNFIARGPDVGLRPNTQRMRATYLVKHIEAGDSVVELMRIAGVQSLDALARYVRFVGCEADGLSEVLRSE